MPEPHGMDAREAMKRAREAVSARQVIGEPIERDGVTVIPAATVFGGGGGGGGTGPEEDAPSSEGSGDQRRTSRRSLKPRRARAATR